MFNGLASLSNLLGMYSGSPIIAAVGSAASRFDGRIAHYDAYGHFSTSALLILPIFLLFTLVSLAVIALMIISWWRVFEKAGRPGWAAFVPIYNLVVMFQVVGMSPWLILLTIIPFVGPLVFFIVSIFMNLRLAKIFGKDDGFAVGLILLPVVFVPILAFGKAKFKSHIHSVGPTSAV